MKSITTVQPRGKIYSHLDDACSEAATLDREVRIIEADIDPILIRIKA